LPDIDFNIRCGNTLVGYATEKELDTALLEGDMFAAQAFKTEVYNQMDFVSKVFNSFRNLQLTQNEDSIEYKQAKHELQIRLQNLNLTLNKYMYKSIIGRDVADPDNDESYDEDIYMLSWKIFCKHAFSNPEEFNILFFSRHSSNLPDVLKEYMDLFPPDRDTSSDVFLEAMFRATSLQDRNFMLLLPLLEGRRSDKDIILVNDMTIAFFYVLLIQLLGKDSNVTPESQTERMLEACRKVAVI
jgi:hypothetical protein